MQKAKPETKTLHFECHHMRTTKMDKLVEGTRSDANDACTASGKKREKKLQKIEQNLSSKEQLAISKHPTRVIKKKLFYTLM